MLRYYIDYESGVLVTEVMHSVTAQDVLNHIQAIAGNAEAHQLHKELIDVRGSGIGLSFSEMFTVVEADQNRCGERERYIAIMVESLLAYGVARMFTQLQGNKRYHIKIFRARDEALQWLNNINLSQQAEQLDGTNA